MRHTSVDLTQDSLGFFPNLLPSVGNKTPDTGPRKIGRLPRKITNNSRYYALQIAPDDLLTKSTIPPQRFSRPE